MKAITTESQIANPTFLVVDDDRLIRQMGRDVLEAEGYTNILTVASIEEANTILHHVADVLTVRDAFNRAQVAGEVAERPRLTFEMYKALGMLTTEDSRYLSNQYRADGEKEARESELLAAVNPEKEEAIIEGLSSYVIGLLDRQITSNSRVEGNHPCIDQHEIVRSAEHALGREHITQKLGVISMSGLITSETEAQSVPADVTVAAGPYAIKKPFDIFALFEAVNNVKKQFIALAS